MHARTPGHAEADLGVSHFRVCGQYAGLYTRRVPRGAGEGSKQQLRVCICVCVGLARTIYTRCTYDIFGIEVTNYTVIYSVFIQF